MRLKKVVLKGCFGSISIVQMWLSRLGGKFS